MRPSSQACPANSNATPLVVGIRSKSFRGSPHRPVSFFLHGIATSAGHNRADPETLQRKTVPEFFNPGTARVERPDEPSCLTGAGLLSRRLPATDLFRESRSSAGCDIGQYR